MIYAAKITDFKFLNSEHGYLSCLSADPDGDIYTHKNIILRIFPVNKTQKLLL